MFDYVVVWIDHHEARLFQVGPEGMHSERVEARPQPEDNRRGRESDHSELDGYFFRDVAGALENADDVLVVGPGTAKLQFLRWMYQNAPDVEGKVISIESAEHPSDAQLISHVKKYFFRGEQSGS